VGGYRGYEPRADQYRRFAVHQLAAQNASLLSFTLDDESDEYDVRSIVSGFEACCERGSVSKTCAAIEDDMRLVVSTVN